MEYAKWAAKALVAGLVAFLGAWITGLSDGAMTQVEWLTTILATIVALGGVFGISNGADPRVQRTRSAADHRG